MKFRSHKTGIFLVLLAFSLLLLPVRITAAVDESEYIVENLKVSDIPKDDGSGLEISWKPLPKERRIIEYRVYRGITPDSLFYIGKIDVNVKTGVPGDVMYFYDTAFNYFMDIQAYGKLRREKQQPKDSPLYLRYPRDANITGPQLTHYDILGVISEKDYYYKNHKVEVVAEEDTTVYAGLKVRNFIQLAKKLMPDHEYYYTVLAVNEARKFFPHCEPAIGIPRANSPEKTEALYAIWVEDLDRLQFEWTLPTFTDDHYYHSIYMMKKADIGKFEQYLNDLVALEENNLAMKIDSTVTKLEIVPENPAQLIYQRYSGYPYTPSKTEFIDVVDGRIRSPKVYKNLFTGEEIDVDIEFDSANPDEYLFLFQLFDADRYVSYSPPAELEVITSNILPDVPAFEVVDRKNDKGDYNYVSWGRPVVFLTNSSYLNDAKTRLLVNYELNTNENYKVRNIYFKVYDKDDNEIAAINEYYTDNTLNIKIPAGTDELNFEMTFRCNNPVDDYVLWQKLVFDEISQSLAPGKLYLGDENLKEFDYYIYKRNYTDEEFRLTKKLAGTQRELDDNISHNTSHFKLVKNFDAEKQLYLVSPRFTIRTDETRENMTGVYLYPELDAEYLADLEKNLADRQTSLDTLVVQADIDQANEAIEYYQEQIDRIKNDPIIAYANSIKDPVKRVKYLDKSRQIAKRSFEYKIVKSDGKGHFTETNIYVKEEAEPVEEDSKLLMAYEGFGKDHFYPRSNWFKTTMIPTLIASLTFGLLVYFMIKKARKGHDLFIRPISGIQEIDNAIGRATEMGKPILFVPGLSGISDVATLAGLAILSRVAKKAAEYDSRILVPVRDYLVLPIAQEIVKEAHYEAGRPDSFDKNSVFFITTEQFAFVAGVNGIMIREKTATNFYMGMFWAESLLMTETGSTTGAIQISGTDAVTQIPFFITTCDYTLIGEELYAASAYMAREPLQMGTLKAVDYLKLIILIFIISGTILSTLHLTFLINAFPEK